LPDGWAFGSQTTHTVTLQDDDLSVFVAPATPRTMEEPADGAGASTRMITVGITQQPPSDVSVTLSAMGASPGTAASGGDFTFADTTVMFARTASELTVTRNITIADDSTPEGDETIILTLTDPTGSLDGTGFSLAGPYTITIPANDNTVGFASNAVATLNEDGTANVEVSVNQVAPVPITLNVATSGTADEGTDYENLPDSVTIGARQSSGTITLRGIDDGDGEGPENIDLELTVVGSLPSGWALGDSEHRVTIQDNDSVVGFATDSATVNETDSNTTYTVNVEISNQPSSDVMLDIAYLARSTAMNTVDATFNPSTVTFSSSDFTPKPITITIVGDTTKETETETFILLLKDDSNTRNNGNNAFIWGNQEFTLNINPSDNVISINSSMSDSTVREDAASPAELVVSVDEPSPTPITLNVSATSPNGAGNGDYTVPSTLVIPANMSTGTLEITAIDDETEEAANLEINLSLSGSNLPTGWGLVDSAGDPATSLTHTVTILDDESAVVGWDGNTSVTHTAPSTGSNTVTLTVRMSKPPSSQIDLVTTFTGTATLGLSQDFFSLGGRRGTGCEHISFSANAMGNDLVQTCNLTILPAAAGKNIIATLSANTPSQLTADGFSVSPTVLTVTVNSP
ncbi:MAG: hypothetical protein OXF05_05390, partial [Hyphomicrobiales bacterium]|nr:hypothetical protein [Hyphomicrobiales bacterium]